MTPMYAVPSGPRPIAGVVVVVDETRTGVLGSRRSCRSGSRSRSSSSPRPRPDRAGGCRCRSARSSPTASARPRRRALHCWSRPSRQPRPFFLTSIRLKPGSVTSVDSPSGEDVAISVVVLDDQGSARADQRVLGATLPFAEDRHLADLAFLAVELQTGAVDHHVHAGGVVGDRNVAALEDGRGGAGAGVRLARLDDPAVSVLGSSTRPWGSPFW